MNMSAFRKLWISSIIRVMFALSATLLIALCASYAHAGEYVSLLGKNDDYEKLSSANVSSSDLLAPSIYLIDAKQAYKTVRFNGSVITDSGKVFNKGEKPYAAWSDCNEVMIRFTGCVIGLQNGFDVAYRLQRSTDPSSGFIDIDGTGSDHRITYKSVRTSATDLPRFLTDLGNGRFEFDDCTAKRGNTYYYRVIARCVYFDQVQGVYITTEKTSNIVSIRTSPKIFSASSFKVKTTKGWKSSVKVKTRYSKVKNLKHKYRITWKRRDDVSGYYVYKINVKQVKMKSLKSWQYAETGQSFTTSTGKKVPLGDYVTSTTAKRHCKKIKTLKGGATSYSFTIRDRDSYSHLLNHCAYVIVPYLKQNGKVYLANAKKAYLPYASGYGGGRGNMAIHRVTVKSKPYGEYVPFVL